MGDSPSASADQRIKNWKYLLTSDATFQVEAIRIIESNVFASQTVTFSRAVALVGLHGTGKTLLLRLLEAAFGDIWQQGPPFFRELRRLPAEAITPATVEGTIEVTLRTPNGLISHVVDLDVPGNLRADIWRNELGGSYYVWYVNQLLAFEDLMYMFQEYEAGGLHRTVETSASRELTADELRLVRNILGRNYDRLSIETIDLIGWLVPYFSGTYQSKRIDSSTMSSGELWVHYIDWWLHDKIPEGSVALIDEPENFMAARGRRPFIDRIALGALRRKLQLIVATHSPEVLARFPLENIRLCVPDINGIQVIQPQSLVQIQDIVGMSVAVRALAFVEDDLAKKLLNEIFAKYDVALTREVEIIPAGGAPEVVSGLRILQRANRLKIAGILDADERSKTRSRDPANSDPIFFLPGNSSPEEELLSAGRREAAWIAEIMGRTVNDVSIAINSCESLDHQYRIRYLASQFGRSESAVIFILTQAWLRNSDIGMQAEKLVKDLREILDTQTASGGGESR